MSIIASIKKKPQIKRDQTDKTTKCYTRYWTNGQNKNVEKCMKDIIGTTEKSEI